MAAQGCEMLYERSRLDQNVSDRGEKTVVWAGDVSHTHESEIEFQENTKYEHNFRDLLFVVVNFDERIQLIFELESQIGT